MDDTSVDIVVRWSEAGQNIPEKTAAGLRGIKAAAGEAAPAIGDRMSQAFARLEAREPTMVLRRARFAIEELTASAIGSTGPVGRLGASIAMLGGATATVAIAGFAGIALEVKGLLEFNDKLDKQLQGLNTKFATLGGTMAVTLRQIETMRQTEVEQPGFLMRFAARVGTLGSSSLSPLGVLRPEESGQGDLNQAIQEGFAAQMATQANARVLTDRQLDLQRRERNQQATGRLLHHITAGGTPEALRALVGRRDDLLKLGAESANLWAKAFLDTVREEDPQKQLRDLLAQHGVFERLGGNAFQEWRKGWIAASSAADMGVTQRHQMTTAEIATASRTGPLGQALPGLRTFDFRGPGEAFLAAHAAQPTFDTFGLHRPLTDRPFGDEKAERRIDQQEERNAGRIAMALGRELGPLIAAFSGGGARGAIAGAGGIAGTLSSLSDPRTGNALLGTAAPYLSLASGVLSGVSQLFGGGGQKPKVIITAFEEQAAQQIKELRGEPLTTQVIVIGAVDMRMVQQKLGELNRLGVLTRIPR